MPYYRFTEEQLEQVNHINIIAYAKSQGYPVEEYSKDYYRIPGFGGLLLEPDKWYWEAEHRGGGPIQFVMAMKHLPWVEAVKELLNIDLESNTDFLYHPTERKSKTVDKSNFRLPPKNTTYKHIFAYLVNARKLDAELVQDLVKNHKLYEDKNENCVFVGYDKNGIERFAALRGTKTQRPFKGDAAGSDKRYAFSIEGTTDALYIFESPIDLISYLTLLKQSGIKYSDHYISLSGISTAALELYMEEHPDIRKLIVCTDNDTAGEDAFIQIYKAYGLTYEVKRQSPKPYKDFNELLVKKVFQDFLNSRSKDAPQVPGKEEPP
ncbi:MAG: DUF3991 domain-containing protein [Lachnospiraceae bacterium]|nr:DUF3991 domain-containing protein [Lachnospiraceae bacterium]